MRVGRPEVRFRNLLATHYKIENKQMKIIRSVKVWRKSIDELKSLGCFEFVKTDKKDPRQVICRFKHGMTQGSPIVHTGDYVVQYETGKWQRMGSAMYQGLTFEPNANLKGYTVRSKSW